MAHEILMDMLHFLLKYGIVTPDDHLYRLTGAVLCILSVRVFINYSTFNELLSDDQLNLFSKDYFYIIALTNILSIYISSEIPVFLNKIVFKCSNDADCPTHRHTQYKVARYIFILT